MYLYNSQIASVETHAIFICTFNKIHQPKKQRSSQILAATRGDLLFNVPTEGQLYQRQLSI